eukprot:TRINITY_DN2063_c0_g1_i1.p1 TRINITY_DN2063_c0_g1~~TRINITY_DN2063_c0_g1_i1.p1  ORF type:complete len:375 (+),score=-22.40 TRINITY_DN2063_c0_g1_i1:45-1169(+)
MCMKSQSTYEQLPYIILNWVLTQFKYISINCNTLRLCIQLIYSIYSLLIVIMKVTTVHPPDSKVQNSQSFKGFTEESGSRSNISVKDKSLMEGHDGPVLAKKAVTYIRRATDLLQDPSRSRVKVAEIFEELFEDLSKAAPDISLLFNHTKHLASRIKYMESEGSITDEATTEEEEPSIGNQQSPIGEAVNERLPSSASRITETLFKRRKTREHVKVSQSLSSPARITLTREFKEIIKPQLPTVRPEEAKGPTLELKNNSKSLKQKASHGQKTCTNVNASLPLKSNSVDQQSDDPLTILNFNTIMCWGFTSNAVMQFVRRQTLILVHFPYRHKKKFRILLVFIVIASTIILRIVYHFCNRTLIWIKQNMASRVNC